MKHSISEIFSIHNAENNKKVLATRRYIETNSVFVITRPRESEGHLVWARPLSYHINSGKPLKVLDLEDIKLAWLYGEKTWFDTEEELAQYRAEVAAETELARRKKKALAEIMAQFENLSVDTLERLARTSLV
jgi:hypothetical protein